LQDHALEAEANCRFGGGGLACKQGKQPQDSVVSNPGNSKTIEPWSNGRDSLSALLHHDSIPVTEL